MARATRGCPRVGLLTLATALGLAGCAYRPGHPVIRGPWGAGGPSASSAAALVGAEVADPSEPEVATAQRIDEFFGDMPQLRLRLRDMRARAAPLDQPIARFDDRAAAEGLLRRLRGRGSLGGTLRNAVVYGSSARLPLAPQQAAGLWLDGQAQGKALGTPAFRGEGKAFELPETLRLAYRVEMLNVGTKPLTFDLVFGTWIEGLELADGTVLLRYDPRPTRGAQHVTLWRGGCIIEPDPAGCVLTEVVLFGTDILLPLLESLLRQQVVDALRGRSINMWGFAYQMAGRPVPPLK